jgi:23S rRNA pseudouridine2605 synthase
MAKERVQKILARAGIASRRKAEELIAEGSVTINGKIAQLGDQAEYGKDSIKVGGRLVHSTEPLAYLAFHKPKGVISMFGDPQGRPSLTDYLGSVKYRLFPVGRLDFNSEGLIILTNDGDFAEKIQRKDDVIRVYHVKVNKHPGPDEIARIERGGRVGQRMFKPHSVRLAQEFTKKALVEVAVVGSGAVDLKAFFESRGILVDRVIRVAFGHIRLTGIEPGKFKYLKPTQTTALLEQPELGLRRQEYEQVKTKKLEPRPALHPDQHTGEDMSEHAGRGFDKDSRAPRRKIAPGVAPKKRDPGYMKRSDPRYGVLEERLDRGARAEHQSSRPSERSERSSSRPSGQAERSSSRPSSARAERLSSRPPSRPGSRSSERPDTRSSAGAMNRDSARPMNRDSRSADSRGDRPVRRDSRSPDSRNDRPARRDTRTPRFADSRPEPGSRAAKFSGPGKFGATKFSGEKSRSARPSRPAVKKRDR